MKQDRAGYKKAVGSAWLRYSNSVNKASILFKKQVEQAWQIFMEPSKKSLSKEEKTK